MSRKHIHIIALDVPFPADYGGAIDMYFRIKALHELGFEIDLHCFEYGRGYPQELEEITSTVSYYRRDKNLTDWFSPFPFIVKTRRSSKLLNALLKDDSPILFEGIHSTFYLGDERLSDRIKIVRTHNVEHQYYAELAKKATGLKRIFYKSEARKLKKYEPILAKADHILAIQKNDFVHFKAFNHSVHLLPACTPPITGTAYTKTEPYCLFHGNLSVLENENAALWILESLGPLNIELVIAGKNPSDRLREYCSDDGVDVIDNPNEEKMQELVQEARVHVLYTDQPTGLKLKLLNALNSSGHVIVNNKMVAGTQLGTYCQVKNTPKSFAHAVQLVMEKELSQEKFEERRSYLREHFDTKKNCELIERLINA
ncbi:MAG: hypothetical protein QNK23_01380 [Crocinitomicaceae bacterium]|nr:hypothetical protein [Crocinitomicaceae bacterium]